MHKEYTHQKAQRKKEISELASQLNETTCEKSLPRTAERCVGTHHCKAKMFRDNTNTKRALRTDTNFDQHLMHKVLCISNH